MGLWPHSECYIFGMVATLGEVPCIENMGISHFKMSFFPTSQVPVSRSGGCSLYLAPAFLFLMIHFYQRQFSSTPPTNSYFNKHWMGRQSKLEDPLPRCLPKPPEFFSQWLPFYHSFCPTCQPVVVQDKAWSRERGNSKETLATLPPCRQAD